MNKILITGGSGMLGKHLREEIPYAYFPNRNEMDLLDYNSINSVISSYQPTHIVHAAAKVGGILDNINKPCDFLEENLLMNTNIIRAARKHNIPRLLAVLSTCMFPDICDNYPITENMIHSGPPAISNFGYGYSKRCASSHIDASNKQYGTKYNYIIPCNLYSEYDDTSQTNKMHFITALLEKIKFAESNQLDTITLLGTGQPLRQFMYGGDLARVIKIMIETDIIGSFSVAPDDSNFTIDYIARLVLSTLGKHHLKITYDTSKPDGQYRKDVSNSLMKKYISDFNFTPLEKTIPRIYNQNVYRPITQMAEKTHT